MAQLLSLVTPAILAIGSTSLLRPVNVGPLHISLPLLMCDL